MSDEHEVALRLRAVVCDGPAKFKVSHMKGHTSSHGCCFCMQIGGKKIAADGKKKGAVLFWAERGDPIVSAMYSTRYPPEHYQADIFERFSPLELIGIDMIYDLVLDCMHLFDLGIVKKNCRLASWKGWTKVQINDCRQTTLQGGLRWL